MASELAPLWFTTVAVAPAAGVITGLTFTSVTDAPPVPFKCVIRRPDIQPTDATAEIIEVTALTGGLVTAGTRNIEGTGSITIEAGYEVYQYVGDHIRPIKQQRWVDDHQYPRTWKGLYDAVTTASGPTEVHVSPGPAILFTNAPLGGYIPVGSDVTIDGHGTEITGAANTNLVYFSANGSGPIGTARALSANAAQAQQFVVVSLANLALLQADGLAVGSYIHLSQSDSSAADAGLGADQSMHRVWSIDSGAGAIYVTPPVPRPFLTAQSATAQVMNVASNIAVRNFRFDGASVVQSSIFMATYWVVDSIFENLRGKNFYGHILWNEFASFGCTFRDIFTENGNAGISVNGAIALMHLNNCTVENITMLNGGWGIRAEANRWTTWRNIKVFSSQQRAFRAHHWRYCTGDNFLLSGCYGTGSTNGHSGFTLSGDSCDNMFTNVQGVSNYECGVLLTHVGGSTFIIKDNYVHGRAYGNNLTDVAISGNATENVLDIKADTYSVLAGIVTNSFGDDVWFDVTHAVGDFTADVGNWTVDLADQIYFRYRQHRNTMTIQFRADATDVSSTPTSLQVKIPNGMRAAAPGTGFARISDAGTTTSGMATVVSGDNKVYIYRTDGAAYTTTAADNTSVQFSLTFEVEPA